MSALGDPIRGFGDMLTEWAATLEAALQEGVEEVARVAVEDLRSSWPVASGASRDAWDSYPLPGGGAEIICRTDYSSYTFAKGDEERIPVYLSRAPEAVRRAGEQVGLAGILADVTEAYVGQGRTTSHLTGIHRKMLIHTPSMQAQAWRENYPELIEMVYIEGYGEQELVPSDTIAAGGAGVNEF